ncbi:MAG: hypothetical protein ABSG92_09670 [Conexivisphaerales archaeon]|jgi:hypothetical protein
MSHDEVTNLLAEELRSEMKALARNLTRRRVFLRALTPVERGILHLSSREGIKLTSSLLRRTLLAIVEKASAWLEDSFKKRVTGIGREKASLNVEAALLMGHAGAAGWGSDADYVVLLGLNALGTGAPLPRG